MNSKIPNDENFGTITVTQAIIEDLKVGEVGPITPGGSIIIDGNFVINGKLTVKELVVTVDATIQDLTVIDTITTKDLIITGTLTIASLSIADLTVTNLATIKDLDVTGIATVKDLTVTDLATVKDIDVTGLATIQDLDVLNTLTIKDLEVTGTATFKGDMITENIYPSADATYTIGQTGAQYNKIYAVTLENDNGGNPNLALNSVTGSVVITSATDISIASGTDTFIGIFSPNRFVVNDSFAPVTEFFSVSTTTATSNVPFVGVKSVSADSLASTNLTSTKTLQINSGVVIGSAIVEDASVAVNFGVINAGSVTIRAARIGRIVTVFFPGVTINNATGGAVASQAVSGAFANSSFFGPKDIVWVTNDNINATPTNIRAVYTTTGAFIFQSTTDAAFNITLNNGKSMIVPSTSVSFIKNE